MIIFGTRGVTTTPQKGEFNCPSCASEQRYGLKRVRRFFTLYFIPVIPLDKLGEYIECMNCKDTYKPAVLDYEPASSPEKVEAEYFAAIKKVMIHVLLADGFIEEAEIDTAMQIYEKVTGTALDKGSLVHEIRSIEASSDSLTDTLRMLQGVLNDEGKEMVVKAALYVALSDGEFQSEEQELLANIARDLGMTQAHLQGVLASV